MISDIPQEGTGGAANASALGRREFLSRLLLAAPAVAVGSTLASSAGATETPLPRNLSFLRNVVDLHLREEWTEERPRLHRLNRAESYSQITVHHQGVRINQSVNWQDVVYDIHNVLDGHLERRFGDIGYHMIIDRAGRVWEGRSLRFTGAHVAEHNDRNVGIMLLGNFERQRPSDKQLLSLRSAIAATRKTFSISSDQVYGHRDLGQTLCPGRHLLNYVHLMQRNHNA